MARHLNLSLGLLETELVLSIGQVSHLQTLFKNTTLLYRWQAQLMVPRTMSSCNEQTNSIVHLFVL